MELLKQMQFQNIKKNKASPGSMRETRCSGLVHWDDPEGCGKEVQDRDHI